MKTTKHITCWLRQVWNNIASRSKQLVPPGGARPIIEDYEVFFSNYKKERSRL